MKPLTESQAWMVIASRYQGVGSGLESYRLLDGICRQVSRLRGDNLITETTWYRMHNRMILHAPGHQGRAYWWKRNTAGADERREFCERMAKLAQR